MNENEFSRMKAAAMEQMREMNARSEKTGGRNMPPAPAFVRTGGSNRNRREPENPPPASPPPPPRSEPDSFLKGLDLPFLDRIKSEGDLALILGLLLILFSEKADKKLLFALLYILL